MQRRIWYRSVILTAVLLALPVNASAADYSFDSTGNADYYPSTSYEDTYHSRYNYGGANLIDYQIPELPYGVHSSTQVGIMEKKIFTDLAQSNVTGLYDMSGNYGISGIFDTHAPGISAGGITTNLPNSIAFTKYSEDFCLSNGAVGCISIPAIGISRYYVWEGETGSSMKKGVAHFSSTSVWDGNVGICGHNRGATYTIGDIKELKPGDKITYTTSEGTRTYSVETVAFIRSDDWSYLESTSDNRITLITCVRNDSEHRWCVQAAVEVD